MKKLVILPPIMVLFSLLLPLTSSAFDTKMNNTGEPLHRIETTIHKNFDLDPVITLSNDSLFFESLAGSNPSPNTQLVTLTNTGGGTLNWNGSHNGDSWLALSPASGSLTAGQSELLTVTITATGIANLYEADISITDTTATNSPQMVHVVFNEIARPSITVDPDTLIFESFVGINPSPDSQKFVVTNTGGSESNWNGSQNNGNWLSFLPTSGTLQPGESDSVIVTVNATGTSNNYEADISIADANADNSPQSVHINYNEKARPSISIDPDTLTFESFVGENPTPNMQDFTITNNGGSDLNWNGSQLELPWLNFTPDSGTLLAGQSETLTVTITATGSPNVYQTDIIIADAKADNSPQIVHINYTEKARPSITINPDTLNFESFVGENPASINSSNILTAHENTITISNTGGSDLNWIGNHSGHPWLDFSPTSGTLQQGQSDTIIVNITATGSPNVYRADISITDDNADNSPQAVHIIYTEKARPSITVDPDTLDFESFVGVDPMSKAYTLIMAADAQNFTITNSGGSELNWNATNSNEEWLNFTPTSGTLQPGHSEPVAVSITATGLPNNYEADISISDSNADNSPQIVHINYSEKARPSIAVSPDTLNFESFIGEDPDPKNQSFTLTNNGGSTLNWTGSHNGGAWISFIPTAGSLGPGQSEVVTITVTATGSANLYEADITIADDNASNSPQKVHINYSELGRPTIVINPDSLKFESFVGVSPDTKSFMITNTGGSTLNWNGTKSDGDWLSFSPISGTLASGQSTNVKVTISATDIANAYEANISITDPNADNSPQDIHVTYIERARPSISLDADTLNFESKVGENPSPNTQTITLTNDGGSDLNWLASHNGGSWLSFTSNSGTLAPGQSEILSVTISATGSQGNYEADITFTDTNADNSPQKVKIRYREDNTVDVDHIVEIPNEFMLYSNYPNPFNPQTTIQYDLPERTFVKIILYNVKGQIVKTLIDEQKPPGSHQVIWYGRTDLGDEAPSGIYFFKIITNHYSKTRKLMLIR